MPDGHAELRPLSRPRARYQSSAGVPRSLARPFAAASPIPSVITAARVRLSTATRAAAASMTTVITRCRRLASRASGRVPPDMGSGAANPVLMVMSPRSPRIRLCGAPNISVAAERPGSSSLWVRVRSAVPAGTSTAPLARWKPRGARRRAHHVGRSRSQARPSAGVPWRPSRDLRPSPLVTPPWGRRGCGISRDPSAMTTPSGRRPRLTQTLPQRSAHRYAKAQNHAHFPPLCMVRRRSGQAFRPTRNDRVVV
jgi:hypothetical protein